MKNFKKCLILGIVLIIITIYCIYYSINSNKYEEIMENDIYEVEESSNQEENFIMLHITGEVNNPRNNKNKRRIKINTCYRSGRRYNSKCRYN